MRQKAGSEMTVAEYVLSEKKTVEFAVWVMGLLLGIFAAVVLLLAYCTPFTLESLMYECWIRVHSGIFCPGCGGTRAFFAFLHGKFVLSFFLHPVVPYMGILYFVFMLRGALHFLSRGKFAFLRFRLGYIYGAIAITLIQFILKNVCLLVFHISWL